MRPREGFWCDEDGVLQVARGSRRALLAGASGVGIGARSLDRARLGAASGAGLLADAMAGASPTPAQHGVDPFALDAVDARVPDEVPALSALLAARHGYIVFERYYGGQDPESADQCALGDQERHRHAGGGRAAGRGCSTGSSRPSARRFPSGFRTAPTRASPMSRSGSG